MRKRGAQKERLNIPEVLLCAHCLQNVTLPIKIKSKRLAIMFLLNSKFKARTRAVYCLYF